MQFERLDLKERRLSLFHRVALVDEDFLDDAADTRRNEDGRRRLEVSLDRDAIVEIH